MSDSSLAFRYKPIDGSPAGSVVLQCKQLLIAGWAGRDEGAIEHHIQELEAIGVRRPRAVPLFYRVAASLLTTAPEIEVVGGESSGEAEAVLIKTDDGLWVGIGSDHTDRKVEAYGVTVSKQICAKPLSAELWRFEDVAPHWDRLVLRSYVVSAGVRSPYQEGELASLRHPIDLIDLFEKDGGRFAAGTAMLCGTVPVHDGFQPSERFELELDDPVLNRTLKHSYSIKPLAIVD